MASSDQRVYRSSYVTDAKDGIDLFWSYTVCDSLEDWDHTSVKKQTLGGATILATTPQAYFPPYHYKRNELGEVLSKPGEEYWNKTIPFEGAMVDYLDQLQTLAAGDFNVEWTFGSKASKLIHPSSAYTASVQDVQDGLIDMAVGPIWMTGERLTISSYTVPLFYSPTVMIVPAPGVDDSLRAQTSKVFAPFEMGVWLMIGLIIFLTAMLTTWFSGESDRRVQTARRNSRTRGRDEPKRLNYAIWGRLGLDSCLRTGTYFTSAGIEQDDGASLPTKLLLFGFGLFTLVVISAYVANLAAFLTQNNYKYVGTIDDATKQGWKVCALPATKEELEVAWPDTKFVFSGAGAGSYHGLIEEWDANKCKAIVYGFANLELKNKLCERDLVITKSVVLENPVAWPIRPDYAAGLSYWMYEADKKHGLKVESLKEEYDAKTEQPSCNVQFSPEQSDSDEYTKISFYNLFLPFVFFGSFAMLAFGLQLHATRLKKNRRRGMLDGTFIGRNSTLGLVASFTKKDHSVKFDLDDLPAELRDDTDQSVNLPNALGLEELQLEDTPYHNGDETSKDIVAQDISARSEDGNGQLHVDCANEKVDTLHKRVNIAI